MPFPPAKRLFPATSSAKAASGVSGLCAWRGKDEISSDAAAAAITPPPQFLRKPRRVRYPEFVLMAMGHYFMPSTGMRASNFAQPFFSTLPQKQIEFAVFRIEDDRTARRDL